MPRLLLSLSFILLLPLPSNATPFNIGFEWEGHVTGYTLPSGELSTISVGEYLKGIVHYAGDTDNLAAVTGFSSVYIVDALNASAGNGPPSSFAMSPGSLSIVDELIGSSFTFSVPPYGPIPPTVIGNMTFATPPLFHTCFGFTTEPRCIPIQGSGKGTWTWANGNYVLEANLEHFWVVPDSGSSLTLFSIGLIGLRMFRRRLKGSTPIG